MAKQVGRTSTADWEGEERKRRRAEEETITRRQRRFWRSRRFKQFRLVKIQRSIDSLSIASLLFFFFYLQFFCLPCNPRSLNLSWSRLLGFCRIFFFRFRFFFFVFEGISFRNEISPRAMREMAFFFFFFWKQAGFGELNFVLVSSFFHFGMDRRVFLCFS